MQARPVGGDQCFLLCSGPALELCLALHCRFHRRELFKIHQLNRKSGNGVGWTTTGVMAVETLSDIGGMTDVERLVATTEDVDEVGDVSPSTRSPSARYARSGSLAQDTIRLAV